MSLLPKKIEHSLPPLGSTENEADPLVRVKFFDAFGSWDWYVIEASRQGLGSVVVIDGNEYSNDLICYGLVNGFEVDFGEFSLKELELLKTPLGWPRIERDENFEPIRKSELKEKLLSLRALG